MKQPLSLVLSSLLVGAPIAAASPSTSGTSPSTPTSPSGSLPTTSSLVAHFDGAPLTASIVETMAAHEGDLARLAGWGACHDGVELMDGCVRFTIDNRHTFVTYVVTDRPCSSTTASGCYGGYAISARADATVFDESTFDRYDATTIWQTRLGRTIEIPTGTRTPIYAYTLDSAPSLTGERRVMVNGASGFVSLTIEDAAGKILINESTSIHAFTIDGVSCELLGKLARDLGHVGATYANLVIWASVLEYGVTLGAVGGALAGVAVGALVGPSAGVSAGGAVFTAAAGGGYTVGDYLGTHTATMIDATAAVAGDLVEMSCLNERAQEDFEPEPFDNNGITATYQTSGAQEPGPEVAAMECAEETVTQSYDSETDITTTTTCWGTFDGYECTEECADVEMLPVEDDCTDECPDSAEEE